VQNFDRYRVAGSLIPRYRAQGRLYKTSLYIALLLFFSVPAQAQNTSPNEINPALIDRAPGSLTISAEAFADLANNVKLALPGVDVSLGAANPGLIGLLRSNPDGVAGVVFQQAAALQQTLSAATAVISGQVANLALDLGGVDPSAGGSAGALFKAGAPGRELSMFAVSGVTKLSHEGFEASSSLGGANGRTPDFEEVDYGFTLGLRWDASRHFGLDPNVLTVGLLANYTHTDIDIGTNDVLSDFFDKTGRAEMDSWSVGTYGLITDGVKYGLVTVTTTIGSPTTENLVLASTADYDTVGVAASAISGVLVPVGGGAKLDLRGGFNFISASADDYTDSAGIRFSDAELEEISGTISAKLLHVSKFESGSLRPFIQGGLTHRFHYRNEVDVQGVTFAFDDADTIYFARAGLDFEIDRAIQAYVAVRGDKSESLEAISAQVGLTFKMD
jgi:hypothetical protein